jgi:hypothetical protein
MIKGELTVYKDTSDVRYHHVARFETQENIYYSYGQTPQQALADMWQIVESLQLRQVNDI